METNDNIRIVTPRRMPRFVPRSTDPADGSAIDLICPSHWDVLKYATECSANDLPSM